MKIAYAVTCFLLGLAVLLLGAVIKVLHWFGADWLLLSGMALVVAGALLLLLRLFRPPASAPKDSLRS
ncbi:hypothetical protein QMK33_06150 [Hymenobacter sp. H14-R3]|uniref:hypothetical protein n=1 Tax=Hymenobacter sp. H14-R3 TaxID=3046308 RepID=UPI0024B9AA41|nr:hypothetical protein [Hymenobacter sp. H14-R3]MDJ0364727.1 hypothetical protein [Hymenobacter sp. H14-R3]